MTGTDPAWRNGGTAHMATPDSTFNGRPIRAVYDAGKNYVLKHKDKDVLEIELSYYGMISSLGRTLNAEHLPVGTADRNGVNIATIRKWWERRSIPAGREGVRDLLENLDMMDSQQLLEKSLGISLSDQYWICPRNADLKWKDVNFFHNQFSEEIGKMLFGNRRMKGPKAIGLISPDSTTDGALKKKWTIIDGKRCLIKGGTPPFRQEVANEVLASRICERLGIPYVNYEIIKLKSRRYCVCEDFIADDTELVTAWHISNLIKADGGTTDYESFVSKAEELGIKDARKRIDMMIVLDFIIVNTDRHYNNFGLVRNADTLEWLSVAPIYDSGTSMWHNTLSSEMDAEDADLESRTFMSKHIKQIKLVKDLSWLDLDKLDGIENEYAKMLNDSVSDPSELTARNRRLCSELRRRIELLGTLTANGTE
ncbi:MAG: HipA domain-containing protein [Methanomassiliicoccaceae archaeon]|nr:HipA domain-containing protein [Methanomassiliicoccaceae archaeon]